MILLIDSEKIVVNKLTSSASVIKLVHHIQDHYITYLSIVQNKAENILENIAGPKQCGRDVLENSRKNILENMVQNNVDEMCWRTLAKTFWRTWHKTIWMRCAGELSQKHFGEHGTKQFG